MIGIRYGDDAVIPNERSSRNRRKIESFETRCKSSMEKSTMCRSYQFSPMQRLGPGQIIEKEIDAMDMNNVGILYELDN